MSDRPERHPASFAQERLFVLRELHPSATLNICVLLTVRDAVAVDDLRRRVQRATERHDALRTSFDTVDGQLQQLVHARVDGAGIVRVIEAQAASDADARRVAEAFAAESIDIHQAPLLRVAVIGERRRHVALCMHHLIADGWSIGLLARELVAADRQSAPAPADVPAIRYAEFARWQRQALDAGDMEPDLAYWRERLDGAEPVLNLPADFVRGAVGDEAGGVATLPVSPALIARLTDFALGEGCSPFMIWFAALNVLLGRLGGVSDVLVVAAHAGRNWREVEDVLGCFINPIVLRTGVGREQTFRELLRAVRSHCFDAFEHSAVPLERVLALLPRSDRESPVRVFFNMLNLPFGREVPGEAAAELIVLPDAGSQMDLSVYVDEQRDGVAIRLGYNRRLFRPARIEELGRQYIALVEQMVARPDERVRRHSLVTDVARAVLPDPTVALSRRWEGSVPQRCAARAAEAPTRIAIIEHDRTWTYADMTSERDRVASALLADGIAPGDVVAIHAERSGALVCAVLGVLEAGAAFLILDASYPSLRLVDYMTMARPRGWIRASGGGDLEDTLAAYVAQASLASRIDMRTLAAADAAWLERAPAIDPASPAYVSFTSGSTGTPKGVLGAHGPLSHFIPWQREAFALSAGDRFSMLSGLAHDPLHRDMFTPLQIGAAICVPSAADYGDPSRLVEWLRASGVTVAHMTPGIARVIASTAPPDSLPALRLALVVGDVLTKQDARRLRRAAPRLRPVNLYGATETQRAVAYHEVTDAELAEAPGDGLEVLPLGAGIPGVQLLVLNDADRLAGIGEVGEMCFRSPHLALGYVGDPELSRARFVTNPITGAADDRVYRTGDLGRYRPDGEVEFAGRSDQQVKIKGFRVEPGEIEAVLKRHGGIADAIVVPHGAAGDVRLAAYVVIAPGSSRDERGWRAFLRARLPAYMMPSAFVPLDALPLTPQGKVARARLPAPPDERPAREAAHGPLEEVIANAWAELLGVDAVGRSDDFFALGGHSLLAARAMARIREAVGVDLPLRSLFAAPTPELLAAEIAAALAEGTASRMPPLVPIERGPRTPASPSQCRLWIVARLGADQNAAYNIPSAVRLRGPLDVDRLLRAANAIVERHESLRTRFVEEDGEPVQVVDPFAPLQMPIVDLTADGPPDRLGAVASALDEEWRTCFDLSTDAPIRLRLLRLAADDHVFIRTIHHIACDAWSQAVFNRELSIAYDASRDAAASPLPPLPIQYADFAAWQRAVSGAAVAHSLAYWTAQLDGAPQQLALPADRPRTTRHAVDAAVHTSVIAPDLLARVERASRARGATVYMTCLATFAALLARCTGQDDLLIGSPIANRDAAPLESAIGCFVNTLVLRIRPTPALSGAELVDQVRRTVLDAHLHRHVPFERIVEAVATGRDLDSTPLVQAVFAFQSTPQAPLTLRGLVAEPIAHRAVRGRYDLELFASHEAGAIALSWVYDRELFDARRIEQMSRHLEQLLEHLVARPDARLDDVALEPHAMLASTAVSSDFVSCTNRFEQRVATHPGAIAVRTAEATLTYGELNERANRLARYLARRGVQSGARVGVALTRTARLPVTLLALFKVGATYVPLDPFYPAARLAYIAGDSRLTWIVSERAAVDTVAATEASVVDLDTDAVAIASESSSNPPSVSASDQIAYAIYTSGSTGQPKGVEIEHASLAHYVVALDAAVPGVFGGRCLHTASMSFSSSIRQTLLPLCNGGEIVVASRDAVRSAASLVQLLIGEHIAVIDVVPSMWRAIIDELEREDAARAAVRHSSLRTVLLASEPLPRDLVGRWRSMFGDAFRIVNMYGHTETTGIVAVYPIPSAAPGEGSRVPIGRPVPGTGIYVLDRHLRPVPVGVDGELFVSSPGLAHGYSAGADATRERFMPNPFGPGRLYRTGDRGRLSFDGDLICLGRVDQQVKIRGFRIEPAEIEAALRDHPDVADVAVIACDGPDGEQRLAAYVVPARAGSGLDPAGLRAAVAARLPDYMVPSIVVPVAAFPLTPTGKLDRAALPPPVLAPSYSESELPRTPHEELLRGLFAEVLGVDRVGIADDFFALGGHSLLATRLVSRVQSTLGVELPLRAVFETPTVVELAQRLQTAGRTPLPPIRPTGDGIEAPLSYAQQRLWFLDRLMPGDPLYTVPSRLRLSGPLDLDAFERSVNALCARHESLRTTFHLRGDDAVQTIAPPGPVSVRTIDLRQESTGDRSAMVDRVAEMDARQPFALDTGPLWRVTLVRTADDEHVAIVTVHHIVSDAWSVAVLVRELANVYGAFATERAAALPDLPVRYADFARWQRAHLRGPVLDEQLAYWRRQLARAEALELPLDRPRTPNLPPDGAAERLVLTVDVHHRVNALARAENVTPFMVLLAALDVLLARYSGQDDIVVACPIANRTDPALEHVVGFIANTLALRVDLGGDPTVKALLAQVRTVALDAYAHQDAPFDQVVEELRPVRELGRNPIASVIFAPQNPRSAPLALGDVAIEILDPHVRATKAFDLELHVWEADAGIVVRAVYSPYLFDADTISRLLAHYLAILEAFCATPAERISMLPMLSERERRELLNAVDPIALS